MTRGSIQLSIRSVLFYQSPTAHTVDELLAHFQHVTLLRYLHRLVLAYLLCLVWGDLCLCAPKARLQRATAAAISFQTLRLNNVAIFQRHQYSPTFETSRTSREADWRPRWGERMRIA